LVGTTIGTSIDHDTLQLSWSPDPLSGTITSYDVRINGGTPITGQTSPHLFEGLNPQTTYTLGVRANGPGGTSAWSEVNVTTAAAPAVKLLSSGATLRVWSGGSLLDVKVLHT